MAINFFRSLGILIFSCGSACFINTPLTINLIGTVYLIGSISVKDLFGVSRRKVEERLNMAQPTQTDPQFKLRMPAAVKEEIEAAAADNNRSMNAEIVDRLERSGEMIAKIERLEKLNRELNAKVSKLERVAELQGHGLDKFYPLMDFLERFIADYQVELQAYKDRLKES